MSKRCDCGFLPPLCPSCHASILVKPRRNAANKLKGQVIQERLIVDRIPGADASQPDCIVECCVCKTRRTVSAALVRKSRRDHKPIRCYTCKPHHPKAHYPRVHEPRAAE